MKKVYLFDASVFVRIKHQTNLECFSLAISYFFFGHFSLIFHKKKYIKSELQNLIFFFFLAS